MPLQLISFTFGTLTAEERCEGQDGRRARFWSSVNFAPGKSVRLDLTLRPPIISAEFWKSITSFLMPKRLLRSPNCPDKPSLKRKRRNSLEVMTKSEGSEIEENISLKIIMEKLNAMEARIEDNFSQVHS